MPYSCMYSMHFNCICTMLSLPPSYILLPGKSPAPCMRFLVCLLCFIFFFFLNLNSAQEETLYKSGLLHLLQISLNISVFLKLHNFVTLFLQILTIRNFIENILYRFLPFTFYHLHCLNLFFFSFILLSHFTFHPNCSFPFPSAFTVLPPPLLPSDSLNLDLMFERGSQDNATVCKGAGKEH